MEIKYLGHSSFLIKTKAAKIVTDPFYEEEVGFSFPKVEADIVTVSHYHKDHCNTEAIKGTPLIIDWPGEFEKKEVRVYSYLTFHDDKNAEKKGENVIYKFDDGEITALHCGDLSHALQPALIDEIGSVDILFVPVGGVYTLNPQEASKLTSLIEPSFVIPMHYFKEGLNPQKFEGLSPVESFLKEMGAEGVSAIDKLIVKKDQLNQDSTTVVLLSV